MNWLDWVLSLMIGAGAFRGFLRGFIIEVSSLVAIIAGIWVAARYNAKVAAWIGLAPEQELIAFLITLVAMLILVQLLAHVLTRLMNTLALGLPNKLAGLVFGGFRWAFILSVLLHVLISPARSFGLLQPTSLEDSRLYPAISNLAPTLVPALATTRWLDQAVDAVRDRVEES